MKRSRVSRQSGHHQEHLYDGVLGEGQEGRGSLCVSRTDLFENPYVRVYNYMPFKNGYLERK